MRLIRVFPRRTPATPPDELAVVGGPTLFSEADRVHVSVAFTWDIPLAEKLAEAWARVAPVEMGGPALGQRGADFIAGQYLRDGYTITSRGCPNRCWFCEVPRREGSVRELPIVDGWNVLDDNLLACSETHIRSVFEMLRRQPRRVSLTGGLEAALLTEWHVDLLSSLSPRPAMFFAYDTRADLDPLRRAGMMLREAGFTRGSHRIGCYVLCGYRDDTVDHAEHRCRQAWDAGFLPMAMVWRRGLEEPSEEWRAFKRAFTRQAIASRLVQGESAERAAEKRRKGNGAR